jgi:hypothetical protein
MYGAGLPARFDELQHGDALGLLIQELRAAIVVTAQ